MTLTHLAANALLKSFYINEEEWSILKQPAGPANADKLLAGLERAKGIRQLFVTTMGVPSMQLL